jgi:hypothetical protein
MKTFFIFVFLAFFVFSFSSCWQDPVGPTNNDTCAVDKGIYITQGDTKKQDEKPADTTITTAVVQPPVIVNVNINNNNNNGSGTQVTDQKGADVNTNNENPPENPVEKPDNNKPVDKPPAEKPKEEPTKPADVAVSPELYWILTETDGQYKVSLSMKNGNGILYAHIVVDYPSCLKAMRVDWNWENERIKEPEAGKLTFEVRNPAEGSERICEILFDPNGSGKGIVGISPNSAFYRTSLDYDNQKNAVPIPLPKVLDVEVK